MHVLSPQICRRDLLQTTHISFRYSSYDRRHDMYMWKCNHHQITFTLVETWLIVLFFSLTLQVEFDWVVKFSLQLLEQLQNTRPLIYMSLNKDSVYCVMPRSSKPPDTWSEADQSGRVFWSFAQFFFWIFYILCYAVLVNVYFNTQPHHTFLPKALFA